MVADAIRVLGEHPEVVFVSLDEVVHGPPGTVGLYGGHGGPAGRAALSDLEHVAGERDSSRVGRTGPG